MQLLQRFTLLITLVVCAQTSFGQRIWLDLNAHVPIFWKVQSGNTDWAHVNYTCSHLGVGLWYKVDSSWSIGAEWSKDYSNLEISYSVPQNTTIGTSGPSLQRIGLAGAFSRPISSTIHQRVKFGVGYDFQFGGLVNLGPGPWDSGSSYEVTINNRQLSRAWDCTLEYGLDFWLQKFVVLSIYGGAEQLFSMDPLSQLDISFREKASGETVSQQHKIRKLQFYAGLGISFTL